MKNLLKFSNKVFVLRYLVTSHFHVMSPDNFIRGKLTQFFIEGIYCMYEWMTDALLLCSKHAGSWKAIKRKQEQERSLQSHSSWPFVSCKFKFSFYLSCWHFPVQKNRLQYGLRLCTQSVTCDNTLSSFLLHTLLLSQDNLIEWQLNITQVECKHFARGDTVGQMQSAAKPYSNKHQCAQLSQRKKVEGKEDVSKCSELGRQQPELSDRKVDRTIAHNDQHNRWQWDNPM